MDLSVFLEPAALLALAGLVALELVLAVDNLIFITILTGRLPPEQQPMGRKLGLLGPGPGGRGGACSPVPEALPVAMDESARGDCNVRSRQVNVG